MGCKANQHSRASCVSLHAKWHVAEGRICLSKANYKFGWGYYSSYIYFFISYKSWFVDDTFLYQQESIQRSSRPELHSLIITITQPKARKLTYAIPNLFRDLLMFIVQTTLALSLFRYVMIAHSVRVELLC